MTKTPEEVLAALTGLVNALGALPAGTLDQASYKAYGAALDIVDPEPFEFTERFMASGGRK